MNATDAYPQLVQALRDAAKISDALHHLAVNGHLLSSEEREAQSRALLADVEGMYETARRADNLLRELGEL